MVENDASAEARLWNVESLRATTFHSVGEFTLEASQVWEIATNEKPEQVSSRPREGLTQAEGTYDNKALLVVCRPDRIDLNIRPVPPPPNVPVTGFVTMGPLLDLLPPFLGVSKNWLRAGPASTRIAFGSVLLLEVADLVSGNRMMEELISSVKLDAEGYSDFFFQINRRRKSAAREGVLINRLTKWSVIQGGGIGVSVHPGVEPRVVHSPEFFSCRLELDMNTAGFLDSPLPGSDSIDLFDELVQLGQEIASQGDIS